MAATTKSSRGVICIDSPCRTLGRPRGNSFEGSYGAIHDVTWFETLVVAAGGAEANFTVVVFVEMPRSIAVGKRIQVIFA